MRNAIAFGRSSRRIAGTRLPNQSTLGDNAPVPRHPSARSDRNRSDRNRRPTMPAEPEPPLAASPRVTAEDRPRRQSPSAGSAPAGWRLQATGLLLFLFIPLVLYLFVRHPEPIAASLGAGIVLMAGHRFLARPYMVRAIPHKCLWCNRLLSAAMPAFDAATRTVDLVIDGELAAARCCAAHHAPAARFFRFLHLARLPLRLGIFAPLLLLLAALAAAGAGHPRALPAATALFQLLVGLTVSAAAWGALLVRAPAEPAAQPVPFPAHNFFLLGVRSLLWVFRLVGAWWIYRGLDFFFS
jgi:hypothetical protein